MDLGRGHSSLGGEAAAAAYVDGEAAVSCVIFGSFLDLKRAGNFEMTPVTSTQTRTSERRMEKDIKKDREKLGGKGWSEMNNGQQ